MRIISNVKQCRIVVEIGQRGDTLPKSGNFCHFWAAFPPRALIGVKFCSAKRIHVPFYCAKFHLNRCNESPLRGENVDFWPVSKFNTGSCRIAAILSVKNYVALFSGSLALETFKLTKRSRSRLNFFKEFYEFASRLVRNQ